jgi:vanillate O-demethylase monooxygenase subunit
MSSRPSEEHDVLIAQDGGVAKARRILSALLRKEQQAVSANNVRVPAGQGRG